MGIGASVFLLAAGAIIAFALDIKVGWLDLDIVGWVLMLCGVIGLGLAISAMSRRRRTVVTPVQGTPVADRQIVEDAPDYQRPL